MFRSSKRLNKSLIILHRVMRKDNIVLKLPSLSICKREVDMFLTAKLNLISGMVIGAFAVMAMKEMCKHKKKHQETTSHADEAPSSSVEPDYPSTA